MEHAHSEKEQREKYAFLTDREATEVFGKLDYELKSGRHIQYEHPEQETFYRFIQRNYESLRGYYQDFFLVQLDCGGIDGARYYYLDYESGARTNIPPEKKESVDAAHLLIGIFACKVYFIDLNPLESSIETFCHLMTEEYEEYKPDFFRLLAQVRNRDEQLLAEDDVLLENAVRSAFREFEKLGWIYFTDTENEQFIVLPSFDRLRKLYAKEINAPRELATQFKKEE